ncbi:MAG: GTP 3',8-cyclase MoaA [Deferrisomatales bacterium]|nr:GTP 3',8-cyclase MoaA [Deferrisomatales bacterium]
MTSPSLRDGFRRTINYLRLSVTDRCNLRCTYCMPPEGVAPLEHGAILSYEEMLRVVRVAVAEGIRKVRVTGGEPLVRRGLLGFVRELARIPGVEDLSLTTNGLLLGELASALRQAGLRRVNVSLDTLRPEVFAVITRRPGLERVLAGIDAARRAGLSPVKINVVAQRGVNDGEILDFAAFAEEGGYEVRFIELMPASREYWDADRVLSAAEILATLRTRYPLAPSVPDSLSGPCRVFLLPRGGRIGVISPLSEHFCGGCNRLRLTASGSLRGCLFSRDETDLRELLRAGADDRALASAVRDVVAHKPEAHRLGWTPPTDDLAMNRIGG